MKISMQCDWQDYKKGFKLAKKSNPFGFVSNLLFFILIACVMRSIILQIVSGMFTIRLWWPALLFVLFLIAFCYLYIPNRTRKTFHQQKEFSAPVEYEFTESTLSSTTAIGHTDRPLSHFVNWKEDRETFLLYHTDFSFFVLPKRFFENQDQIEIVRGYFRQSIPQKTNKAGRIAGMITLMIVAVIIILLLFRFN